MQPIVGGYTQNPPEHRLFWQAFARLACAMMSITLAYATVYTAYFLKYFFFANGEDN